MTQPTLFVGGRADPALAAMQGTLERMRETYPHLTAGLLLDGVGHGVPEEAPEALSRALLDWLRGR